ncbi:MAG: AbrB/MazE/SpoVT family DNA-binding domain-containing protein [Candidatus Pacebacteria bacterium]|nr:AbrB/MazE/SpoVT family DNA-binding domain-containing protein [Candidatus Paceibacterota bacterium]
MENSIPLVQVKSKSQITLPQRVRNFLGIQEGDYLEVKIEKNAVVLKPKTILDKLPVFALSSRGEAMLQEAFNDVKAGRVKKFENIKDLIKDLHK